MGVYVKDATAPKNCTGCIAVHYYVSMAGDAGMLCEVTGLSMDDYYSDGRPDWCPLIEVPEPHGRLIDADEMFDEFVAEGQRSKRYKLGEKWELNGEEIRSVISRLPTVIPASEEG